MSSEENLVPEESLESPGNRCQFLWGLLVGVAALCLLWLALFAGQLGRPHPFNVWVEQSYAKKSAYAKALGERPKIIVVGGSSSMFGIDSRQLEEQLRRPVVNLGVNAGIGPLYIAHHTRDLINPGDLVILPLEYPLYTFDGEINQVILDYTLSHPHVLSAMPLEFWLRTMWLTSVKRLYEGYRGIPDGFEVKGLYGPRNLDERGDQINAALSDRSPAIHKGAKLSKVEDYGKTLHQGAYGWQVWREFYQSIQSQGACAIFVPPAMLDRPEYHENPLERRFYREFPTYAGNAGLPYSGDPRDFLYPVDWFFDTNYHLVAERKTDYTMALIALVQQAEPECQKIDR